jgi:transcriptional regulator with XRE-family HTH domain
MFKVNLRAELDYQGLSVRELSEKTGISKRTLDCYLRTQASIPPADVAVRIADALGVSVEFLVKGKSADNSPGPQIVRSTLQIMLRLDDRDRETIYGLARVLRSQTQPQPQEAER